VYTLIQTPRRWGDLIKAGLLVFPLVSFRPCLTNWFIVGIFFPFPYAPQHKEQSL
jgi:hypothetical protein